MRYILSLLLLFSVLSCFDKNDSAKTSFEKVIKFKKQVKNVTYYFPSSLDTFQRQKLIDKCEMAILDNLKLIEENSFTDTVDVEFLDNRKDMLKYTGMGAAGMAFPERKTLFSLANEKEAPIKHELLHLIAMLKWGEPHQTSIWMNEGLATFSENNCNNYNVEQIYCYLLSNKMLIPLDSLASNFYGKDEMISYHQSAFLVQYLLSRFGITKFKELWKNGINSFTKIYGSPVNEILATLNENVKSHFQNVPSINWEEFKKGCN